MKEKKYITREMTPEEMLACKFQSKYKFIAIPKKHLEELVREYALRAMNLSNFISEKRRDIEFMDKQAEGKIPFDQEFILNLFKECEDQALYLLQPLFEQFIPYAFAPDGDLASKPVAIRKMITYLHNMVKKAAKRIEDQANGKH
jgi:hypothetical protein